MVENLDSSERTGGFASLALDAKNNPHIAYSYSLSGGHYSRLKYISRSGGNWKVETVDGASASYTGWFAVHVGWFASLALDAEGHPHIAYYDRSAIRLGEEINNLKYARKSGSSWTIETVDSTGDVGKYASLALDSESNPRIAYNFSYGEKPRYSQIRYASKSKGNWTIVTVSTPRSAESNRFYILLALDSGDDPHMAYYEMTKWMHEGTPEYARKSRGTWIVETVDSGGNVGEHPSLALDTRGRPHIAYYDATNGHLKYAIKNERNWTVETVDSTKLVGWFASLALDIYNNPRIAYYDATNFT